MRRKLQFAAQLASLAAVSATPGIASAMHQHLHHHHAHHAKVFGSPENQEMPFGCAKRCNPPNHVHYLKNNFPDFYDIVTQNSPKSKDSKLTWNGMLAFSGIANFDLRWNDRRVGPLDSHFWGDGVRPVFSDYEHNITGNINNINFFIDTALNNWVTGHFDLAYVNASQAARTYSASNVDWGSVYRPAAGLRVNQAYLLFANPAVSPVYVQVGRVNHPFGDYDPFPLIPSLTQLISEIRTGGIVVGAVLENGFYGSVQWTMSEQSMENRNGYEALQNVGNNKDRNYGAKLGFRTIYDNVYLHANASYIADIRDADYLLEAEHFVNAEVRTISPYYNSPYFRNTWGRMHRAAGLSLHGEADYLGYGVTINFVKALSDLNQDPAVKNTKLFAWDITAHAKFDVHGCPAKATISYQAADNTDVIETFVKDVDGEGAPPAKRGLGNLLPRDRFTLGYQMSIMPSVNVAFEWSHDRDFRESEKGTDDVSNLAVVRLQGQF